MCRFPDLPTMQWIASTALTLASVTVAVVAATFNYRQNRGWKPAILVLSQGFDNVAWIDFEVWNRRKYPIVIHFVEIKFGNMEIDQPEKIDPWYIFHNKLIHRQDVRLEPASHHRFEARAALRKGTFVKSAIVTIDVFYFDPVANKRKKLTREHQYEYMEG